MKSRNLDLLRSFAVILVVGYHLARFFNAQFARLRVTDCGLLGVMLFFVHTTLVLMFSIERQQGHAKASPTAHPATRLFLSFMTRRFFRIYPLSILVVLFVWLFRIPSDLQFGRFELLHQTAVNLIANLLLIQNITRQKANPGPLWSLPLEFQMYLILPALFLFAARVKAWWAPIVFWCSTVALWFALGFASGMLPLSDGDIRSPAEALLKFTRFAPCFLPGIIAYKLWGRPRELPGFLWPAFLLLCCGVFILFAGSQPIEAGWFICLGVGLAVSFFREVTECCLTRVAQTIAQYSYGIYLLHYFAIWFGFACFKTLNIGFQTIIFIATLITLPVILYHTVEAPMIARGVRASSRIMLMPLLATSETIPKNQAAQPWLVKGSGSV